MLRYHSIYQCLQQKGHFCLTKAGERYVGTRGVRLKDNRAETKLKQQKVLRWREGRSVQARRKEDGVKTTDRKLIQSQSEKIM